MAITSSLGQDCQLGPSLLPCLCGGCTQALSAQPCLAFPPWRGALAAEAPPPRFLGSPAQHKGGCGPLGLWVAMFAEMAASPSFLSASNWAPLPQAVANLVWRSTAPLAPLPTIPLIEASGPCWDPQCGNWQQHAGGRQPRRGHVQL